MKRLIFFFTLSLSVSVLGAEPLRGDTTFLPMNNPNEITDPKVFADRIEESLKKDPSGKGTPRGSNLPVNEILRSVNHVTENAVGSAKDLPTYFRNLTEGPMPEDQVALAQAKVTPHGNVADLTIGVIRAAHPGEKGWYDANSGKFIMAGKCSNVSLKTRELRIAKDQQVGKALKHASPFGGAKRCPLGSTSGVVYLKPIMREPAAATHECSQAHMLAQDGHVPEGGPENWVDGDAFSRNCGPLLGKFKPGSVHHEIVVVHEKGDGNDIPLFEGTLTGDKITAHEGSEPFLADNGEAIAISKGSGEGYVVVKFKDQSRVRTPTASGVGERLSEFQEGCRALVLTGVDL